MVKYTDEIKAKCVELAKEGKSFAEITRQLGPNAKAVQRYCKKAGFELPKRERKPKAEKAPVAE